MYVLRVYGDMYISKGITGVSTTTNLKLANVYNTLKGAKIAKNYYEKIKKMKIETVKLWRYK